MPLRVLRELGEGPRGQEEEGRTDYAQDDKARSLPLHRTVSPIEEIAGKPADGRRGLRTPLSYFLKDQLRVAHLAAQVGSQRQGAFCGGASSGGCHSCQMAEAGRRCS